jgi:poly-gamma-glutamate synthesis protein (capsule biosynthesis protein)
VVKSELGMIKIGFTGDILSYPNQNKRIKQLYGEYDYSSVFKEIGPLFDKCDYVCGSLETPISSQHDYSKNEIVFNTPESFLYALKEIGMNLLTTANNHCLDRGISGLNNTIDSIIKTGLDYTGTRKSPAEKNYLIKTISGVRVAFVAFTYDTNADANNCCLDSNNDYAVNLTKKQWFPITTAHKSVITVAKSVIRKLSGLIRPSVIKTYQNPVIDCVPQTEIKNPINTRYINLLKETIDKAKKEADFMFFLLHSGGQFNSDIGEYTNFLVDIIHDCGADAVICNHTHCVLPIKKGNDCVFAYSLGNFSFTPQEGYYIEGVLADYSIILYLTISDEKTIGTSFSIIKNIVCDDGISRVFPVYDLYSNASNLEEKQRLNKDVKEMLERINYNGDFAVKQEYFID